jgi:hypothetical protein
VGCSKLSLEQSKRIRQLSSGNEAESIMTNQIINQQIALLVSKSKKSHNHNQQGTGTCFCGSAKQWYFKLCDLHRGQLRELKTLTGFNSNQLRSKIDER